MDFSNFKEIVNFAIEREEEAYMAYEDLSQKAERPGMKELLLELRDEEKKHKELLTNIDDEEIAGLEIHKVIDLKISDFLTEEPPTPDMTFQDLLILAAKKEQQAVELYTGMKESVDSAELKKLFDFLIEQEKSHKLKLETEYEKRVLSDG